MVEPSAFVVVIGIVVSTVELDGPLFFAVVLCCFVVEDCCCCDVDDCCCCDVDDCCAGVDDCCAGVEDCCADVLVETPVPAACLFGMMPSGISSALIDAKPRRKASMMATNLDT